MIVLDTHIWVWWVYGSAELSSSKRQLLSSLQADGLGVSAISCWEIAKLVEKGRLSLAVPVGQWIDQALVYPGIRLLPLDPKIAVASTQLPPAIPQRSSRSNYRSCSARNELPACNRRRKDFGLRTREISMAPLRKLRRRVS